MDDETRSIEPGQNHPDSDAAPLLLPPLSPPILLEQIRARTPARILSGRAGAAYRTITWLELRRDHAAAKDAVRAEIDLADDFGPAFVDEWGLFEVATLSRTKQEFLLRPDLARCLNATARAELTS